MKNVVVVVPCKAAGSARCYAPELVEVAEECRVPFTWLITVSSADPMSNVRLYHTEYLHRIPAWHEVGVCLEMKNGADLDDPGKRGDLVKLGKEMLKQAHVKPASCLLAGSQLMKGDVAHLEKAGFAVVMARVQGRDEELPVPYHPSDADPAMPGASRLVVVCQSGVDVASHDNIRGHLAELCAGEGVLVLTTADDRNDTEALKELLPRLRELGAMVQTLTAVAMAW